MRGRERKRERKEKTPHIDVRERHLSVPSCTCPSWGSNLKPFSAHSNAQPTEPHQPGPRPFSPTAPSHILLTPAKCWRSARSPESRLPPSPVSRAAPLSAAWPSVPCRKTSFSGRQQPGVRGAHGEIKIDEGLEQDVDRRVRLGPGGSLCYLPGTPPRLSVLLMLGTPVGPGSDGPPAGPAPQ